MAVFSKEDFGFGGTSAGKMFSSADFISDDSSADQQLEQPQAAKNPQNFATDTAQDFIAGALRIPQAATGLADIGAGLAGFNRPFDRATDTIGEYTGFQPSKLADSIQANNLSPERKAADAAVDQAWNDPNTNGWDVAKAYLQNPRAIAGNVVESVPTMFAGGLLGNAAKGLGLASKAIAPAVGEGAMSAGQMMSGIDDSVDPQKAAALSALGGAGVGALGRFGNKVSDKLGLVDPDVAVTNGLQSAAQAANLSLARRLGGGFVAEGALEEVPQSLVEQGAQNLAEDKPFTEGMARQGVEGLLAGGLMGSAFNAMPRAQQPTPETGPTWEQPSFNDIKNGRTGPYPRWEQPSYKVSPLTGEPIPEETESSGALGKALNAGAITTEIPNGQPTGLAGAAGIQPTAAVSNVEPNNTAAIQPVAEPTNPIASAVGGRGIAGSNEQPTQLDAQRIVDENTRPGIGLQAAIDQQYQDGGYNPFAGAWEQPSYAYKGEGIAGPRMPWESPQFNDIKQITNEQSDITGTESGSLGERTATSAVGDSTATGQDEGIGNEAKSESGGIGNASDIFSEDWFAGAQKEIERRNLERDTVKNALKDYAAAQAKIASDLRNKTYKDNKRVVDFGDSYHPYSDKTSMSIGDINESKKKRRIEQADKNYKKAVDLFSQMHRGELTVESIAKEIDRIEKFVDSEDARIPKGMSKQDYVESIFAQSFLDDTYGAFGSNSIANKIINVVKRQQATQLEPSRVDNEQSTNTATQETAAEEAVGLENRLKTTDTIIDSLGYEQLQSVANELGIKQRPNQDLVERIKQEHPDDVEPVLAKYANPQPTEQQAPNVPTTPLSQDSVEPVSSVSPAQKGQAVSDNQGVSTNYTAPSILTEPKKQYLLKQERKLGLKRSSPGYEAKRAELEDQYIADVDAALANAPFDVYANYGDNKKLPESLARQAHDELRNQYGIANEPTKQTPEVKPVPPNAPADTGGNAAQVGAGEGRSDVSGQAAKEPEQVARELTTSQHPKKELDITNKKLLGGASSREFVHSNVRTDTEFKTDGKKYWMKGQSFGAGMKQVPKMAYEYGKAYQENLRKVESETDIERVASEAPQAPAIHIEGKTKSTATVSEVNTTMKKAAERKNWSKTQMRDYLVGEIDKAIESAHDFDDVAARHNKAKYLAEKELGRFAQNKTKLAQKTNEMLDRVDMSGYVNDFGQVTFDVPGDGKFKVLNTKQHLEAFKQKVLASPGFKETRDSKGTRQPTTKQADTNRLAQQYVNEAKNAKSNDERDEALQMVLDIARNEGYDKKTLNDLFAKADGISRARFKEMYDADQQSAENQPKSVGTQDANPDSASPIAKPTSAEKAAEEPVYTGDAGAELTANRRSKSKVGLKWDDIADKNDALKVKEATKQNVYPKPDYEAMVEAGKQPILVHILKQVYDSISIKPTTRSAPTDEQLQEYIAGINRVMSGVEEWMDAPNGAKAWAIKQAGALGTLRSASAGASIELSKLNASTEGKRLLDFIYPTNWKDYRSEVLLLGGNKLLGGLQPGYDEIVRAIKDVGNGWPAKQEMWKKRGYQVVASDKLTFDVIHNGLNGEDQRFIGYVKNGRMDVEYKFFKTKQEAEAFVAAKKESLNGKYVLLDKLSRFESVHDTEDQAVEAARDKITGKSGKVKVDSKGISVAMAKREGVAHRMEGEDVSTTKLIDTFGFKGVNFGNWMKGETPAKVKERQLHLNHIYDSFMDLAEVLNVPPKAMSLNGMLGVAVGAQGTGGSGMVAAAHFVPGVNEINLTRESGAGSLAHEWGHALDHYFATQAGFGRDADPWITSHSFVDGRSYREIRADIEGKNAVSDGIRPEIAKAFKTITTSMNRRDSTPAEIALKKQANIKRLQGNIESWIKSIERDYKDIPESAAYFAKIRDMDVGDGLIAVSGHKQLSPVLVDLRDLHKRAKGRVYSLDQMLGLQSNINALQHAQESKGADKEHIPQVDTDYTTDAQKLDKGKGGKPYWNTPWEKFARAFDAFVSDELAAKAQKNTYLSHAGRNDDTVPRGEERKAINAAFKTLVGEIQTKETDKGVALFSKQSPKSKGYSQQQALNRLAKEVPGIVPLLGQQVRVISEESAIKLAGNAAKGAQGFVVDDTVYFVHDNIDANTDLNGLALHEVAVHALQLGKDSAEFKAILKQVETMLSAGNKKMLEAQAMVPSDTKVEHKTEETLAYFVQSNPSMPLAKRFMAWFRNALRAIGKTIKPLERVKFIRWANALTTDDLTYMAQQALKSAPTAMQFKGGRTQGVWFSGDNSETESQRQYREIETRYFNPDGSEKPGAMLAPNGERSNLNKTQWIQVRTDSFKQWFGDWETTANLAWLDNGEPVASMRGDEIPAFDAMSKLIRWVANEWETNHGGVITRNDVGDILINKASARSSLGHGYDAKEKIKMKAFYLVPDALKNGVLLGNLPHIQGKPRAFLIAAPVSIGGKKYKMYVEVRETDSAQRMYVHEVVLNNPVTSFKSVAEVPEGSKLHVENHGAIFSFLQQLRNVNASKVVDENGEPLVVYHGTGGDFTEFENRTDDLGFHFGNKDQADDVIDRRHFDSDEQLPLNTMSVYLDIKNPADLSDISDFGDAAALALDMEDRGLISREEYNAIGGIPGRGKQRNLDQLNGIRDLLVSKGYDGFVYENEYESSIGDDKRSYIALTANQIKSATGNNGDFSTTNNDIRFSKGIPQSVQSAKDKYLDKDTNIYRFQDRFIDLKRQIEKAVSTGNPLSAAANPYKREELYHQRLAARVDDFNKHELDPILKALKDQPTLEKFQKYLQAKHAPSRNAVMAERNPNQAMIDQYLDDAEQMLNYWELKIEEIKSRNHSKQELKDARAEYRQAMADVKKWRNAEAFKGTEEQRNSLSGMSNQQSRDFLRNLPAEERTKFDRLGAQVESITNKTLDLLVDYGMETQETVDALRAQWQHYVPLYRDEAHSDDYTHPIGRGFSVRGSGLKSATGSNAEVTNILAHIAAQREQMLRRGEKNIVTQSIANFVEQYPDSDFAEVDKKEFVQKLNDDGLVETNMTPQQVMLNNPNVVAFRVDGKNHYIVFNDDKPETMRLAASLQNMDGAQLNAFENFVAKGTRYMAAMSTQYNVVFGLFNLMRDTGATALNLSTTKLKGDTGKVISGILPALKTIWQVERESGNPTDARLYKQFKMDGATTGFTQMFNDINHRNENLVKRIERLNKRLSLHDIGQFVTDYNTVMENATRFAAYKAAIAKGLSRSEAASIAKNITVNFNRKGSATTEISAAYAFFNASVQGTARMAETLKGENGKQILMGGVALGVINTLLGIALMGDDDWEKIPEYDRERNLIIPYGDGDYGKIPMPLGFHIIPSIGRKLTEMAIGSNVKTPQARLLELFGEVADAFNPLGGGGNLMLVASPTVADPAISLATNRDFKNTPISREDMNSLNPTPGFTRSKESATAFSKKMAELINKGTGGTNAKQGLWSPTADQIDYVFGQIFGGTGREAMRVSKTVESLASGEKPTLKDIPVAGRLLGETKGEEPERRAYYDNVRKLNEHEAEIKWMRQNGKGAEIGKYRAENPEANLVIMANHTESAIKKLKDRRNALKARDADSASIKLVDKMILKQMERLNQKVFDAQK